MAVLAAAGPASAAKPTSQEPEMHYFYAGAQHTAPEGSSIQSAAGSVTHHAPTVRQSDGDIHSHASIALIDFDPDGARDIVEAGWIIHPGEAAPHLYVASYVNDVGTSQDGHTAHENPPFVSFASPKPGDPVGADGLARELAFAHLQTSPTDSGTGPGWYLRYDGRWLGYFPDALWETTTPRRGKRPATTTPSDFTSARGASWSGEVASSRTEPCADMGSGVHASELGAAEFSDLTVNGTPVLLGPYDFIDPTPGLYSVAPLAMTDLGGFRFGGPGGC